MALRAGYKGFKKLLAPLKIIRPGTLAIDNDILIPELNKIFFSRSEQAVLGAKNIMPNNKGTETVKNVVYTVASDGEISVSGQIQSPNTFSSHWISLDDLYLENGKKYILSGCPEGGGSTTYFLRLGYGAIDSSTDTNTFLARDEGSGVEFIADSSKNYRVQIRINTTEAISNKVFKPMIRLATDPDDTYAPYAMTNRELTDALNEELGGYAIVRKTLTNETVGENSNLDIIFDKQVIYAMVIGSDCKNHYDLRDYEPYVYNYNTSGSTTVGIRFNQLGTKNLIPQNTSVTCDIEFLVRYK